jgi:hypothetical protein
MKKTPKLISKTQNPNPIFKIHITFYFKSINLKRIRGVKMKNCLHVKPIDMMKSHKCPFLSPIECPHTSLSTPRNYALHALVKMK